MARDNGSDITWDDAKSYCENLTLGGFSDWRLPSIRELEGLSSARRGAMQSACCPWSSDLKIDDLFAVWILNLHNDNRGWRRLGDAEDPWTLCVRGSGG